MKPCRVGWRSLVHAVVGHGSAAGYILQPTSCRRHESANEQGMARITSLVRGRVVDVLAELGQEASTGRVLAILASSDLAAAQSTSLKTSARFHVARHAASRVNLLRTEHGIGIGEDQRRQGEMTGRRAANREARDHWRLLGMNRQDVDRLDRQRTLRSHVSIEAPFNGRVLPQPDQRRSRRDNGEALHRRRLVHGVGEGPTFRKEIPASSSTMTPNRKIWRCGPRRMGALCICQGRDVT